MKIPLETRSRRHGGPFRIVALVACLLFGTSAAPEVGAQTASIMTSTSPYRSVAKTRRLVDALANRLVLQLGYTEDRAGGKGYQSQQLSGLEIGRYFRREVDGGSRRTLEVAVTRLPGGGLEVHLVGTERGVQSAEPRPNPDVASADGMLRELDQQLAAEQAAAAGRPTNVAYQTITLSYVQVDRAIAILKALGFSTVEYAEQPGESAGQKNFLPTPTGDGKLPMIVKLIDSSKTSLMDPSNQPPNPYQQVPTMPGLNDPGTLPDLGGLYLHSVTAGEPHQRLMIVYDPDEPETLESLMNLLTEQIDVPARQILIEALVIELNANKLTDLGLSYGLRGRNESSNSGTSRDVDGSFGFPAPEDITDPAKVTADTFNPFTFVFNQTGLADTFKFRASLNALVGRGDAEILSNPSVLVLDGRQARIQIGQNRPVVETTATNFATQSTVRYFPVGIVLNLRPRVAEDGSEIVMQVETIVSSVALSGSTEGVLFAPVVDNRQVQTFVRVSNDTPFIIGGLISTERTNQSSGVPILSEIPVFGALFRHTVKQTEKKEVIVVLTPHVVPVKSKNYSYVIPQETEIFDSFDHQLFRNAYRVREQDVFDLKFLHGSSFYATLRERLQGAVDIRPELLSQPEVAAVVAGGVPGEEVLVRRMLWEIVGRSGFSKSIPVEKIIFFENAPDAADGSGFKLSFLGKALRDTARGEALFLTYGTDIAGTAEHPFVQPRAYLTREVLAADQYVQALARSNHRKADGEPDQWTAILSSSYSGITSDPLELLKRVLVLKRVLALNPNLSLTLKEFYAGRQIVFPTDEDLAERFHLLDPEAAKLFYEVALYYPAFEQEFMYQNRKILRLLSNGAP